MAGYRSLQELVLPLGPLTLVWGVNGCGKSNVYRALGLIAAAARGELVAALSAEGGDLAATVQTILKIGDGEGLRAAIADAFPLCRLTVVTSQPSFRLQLHQPGLLRPVDATEISDGRVQRCVRVGVCADGRLGTGREPRICRW